MCLAVPMKLIEMKADGHTGIAELDGVRVETALDLVPDAKVGDYLLIHTGFAIERMDEERALEDLALLRSLGETNEPG